MQVNSEKLPTWLLKVYYKISTYNYIYYKSVIVVFLVFLKHSVNYRFLTKNKIDCSFESTKWCTVSSHPRGLCRCPSYAWFVRWIWYIVHAFLISYLHVWNIWLSACIICFLTKSWLHLVILSIPDNSCMSFRILPVNSSEWFSSFHIPKPEVIIKRTRYKSCLIELKTCHSIMMAYQSPNTISWMGPNLEK